MDPTQQGIVFKSQLYALTSVPVTSQKIMVKGKVVKDDDDLSKFGLKDGMTIMMMGTAEGKELKEPEKPIVFFEDMTPEQKARALNETLSVVITPGLVNLGNTCYMASTVQMLRRVNELKAALKNLNTNPGQMDNDSAWAGAAGRLMKEIDDNASSALTPF